VGILQEDVPAEVIEKEKEIYRAQALEMGKPEKMIDKIAEGKLNKFFKESCLMNQVYVRDPNITIQDYLNEVIAKTGEKINIRRFARFQVGE
jgi:elongation factor Ts